MKFFNKFLYLFLLAGVAIGIFLIPELIKITKVECGSQFGPCSDFISGSLEKYQQTSLRAGKKEISNFLSKETQIENFSLRFKLPSTIVVSVLEKKARFAIADKEKGVFATIDEGGSILAIFPETNLPYVELSSKDLNVGEKISAKELTALNLQERVYSAYQVKGGQLISDYLLVNLNDGYTVLFPLGRDPEETMGALTLILSSLKGGAEASRIGEGVSLKTIDLRFKNPVLK